MEQTNNSLSDEEILFNWDKGNLFHIEIDNFDRGIFKDEIESIFKDSNKIINLNKEVEDEIRYICVGFSNNRRVISVIFSIRENKIRPITAWKTRKTQTKIYYDKSE